MAKAVRVRVSPSAPVRGVYESWNRLVGDIVNAYGRHDENKVVPPNVTRSIRSGSGDR